MSETTHLTIESRVSPGASCARHCDCTRRRLLSPRRLAIIPLTQVLFFLFAFQRLGVIPGVGGHLLSRAGGTAPGVRTASTRLLKRGPWV
jgi:hypothetical protein